MSMQCAFLIDNLLDVGIQKYVVDQDLVLVVDAQAGVAEFEALGLLLLEEDGLLVLGPRHEILHQVDVFSALHASGPPVRGYRGTVTWHYYL